MRFVTPLALALALAVTSGAITAPAMAQKKEKQQKKGSAPKLNVSPEVLKSLQTAQAASQKQDFAGAKAALADADSKAKSNDDKYQIAAIKLNVSIESKDAALQSEAVNAMLDSGLTPPEQAGQLYAVAAEQALGAKNYDVAIQRAQGAIQVNYKPEMTQLVLAQAYFGKAGNNVAAEPGRGLTQQGLTALKAAADATKAAGGQVPGNWYQIGVSRAVAAKLPETNQWATMAYQAAPNGENLRTLIRLFQQSNPNISTRENLDVLRLMSASGGLVVAGDYTEYAETASRLGIHGEVKSVIEAGRAKNVLNPTQGGDYYQQSSARIASDKSTLGAAEADARKAANGKIAAATADAYLGYGNYAKAGELFALALQKGGVDADEVNTRLGIAKTLGGDMAGAKSAFGAVKTGTRKQIADLWLTYLNTKSA